jgi:hypothetical protein
MLVALIGLMEFRRDFDLGADVRWRTHRRHIRPYCPACACRETESAQFDISAKTPGNTSRLEWQVRGKFSGQGGPVMFRETMTKLAKAWRDAIRELSDPYRPELHYMRGPGPKWAEKHQA